MNFVNQLQCKRYEFCNPVGAYVLNCRLNGDVLKLNWKGPPSALSHFQLSNSIGREFCDYLKKMSDHLAWPSELELNEMRKRVAEMAGSCIEDVKVVASPYRICPLGAHIDHQGGTVSAMTINRGILLGFVPSGDPQVLLHSAQFKGEVSFRVDEIQNPKDTTVVNDRSEGCNMSKLQENSDWGNYARGALYALQSKGNHLTKGIIGLISGSEGLDSSGLSSSAAVGVAYLLAFESANGLVVSAEDNIEYDRLIENQYLGLKNGILDQSAILLSSHGCLTYMNCKTKEYQLVHPPKNQNCESGMQRSYKILLAFSGLKQALTSNPGYNRRVTECQEAARLLLKASGNEGAEPFLSNVDPTIYETHKDKLDPTLARRAEHYFSENMRVVEGVKAWASGNVESFGKLISDSGLSSIKNYECGCEALIQLYEILLKAPGVYGARFSGAGFRGCCIALVDAASATEAKLFVENEYKKVQPRLASQISPGKAALICEGGDCARLI